jgi:hypothetical protein
VLRLGSEEEAEVKEEQLRRQRAMRLASLQHRARQLCDADRNSRAQHNSNNPAHQLAEYYSSSPTPSSEASAGEVEGNKDLENIRVALMNQVSKPYLDYTYGWVRLHDVSEADLISRCS